MHFTSLHGHDRTHEAQQIVLLIYVDSSYICGYACSHISAHRIAHTHLNEQTKRIGERTKRIGERTERILRIVLLDELNRFVNQVISSESNNRI